VEVARPPRQRREDFIDVAGRFFRGVGRAFTARQNESRLQPFQRAGECRAFLTGRGVRIAGGQQTKTKTALEYFSREARQGGSA